MKFYNFVMFLLTCFCIGVIVFGLTGCASYDWSFNNQEIIKHQQLNP